MSGSTHTCLKRDKIYPGGAALRELQNETYPLLERERNPFSLIASLATRHLEALLEEERIVLMMAAAVLC